MLPRLSFKELTAIVDGVIFTGSLQLSAPSKFVSVVTSPKAKFFWDNTYAMTDGNRAICDNSDGTF